MPRIYLALSPLSASSRMQMRPSTWQTPLHSVWTPLVFTADIELGRKVAAKIESGMVFINRAVRAVVQLPFRGVKNSGFGLELSELGFGEFVNVKLINVAPPDSPPWEPVHLN